MKKQNIFGWIMENRESLKVIGKAIFSILDELDGVKDGKIGSFKKKL